MIATRGAKIYRCQVKASTFHKPDGRRYLSGKLQWHFGVGGAKRHPTIKDYDFAACVSIPHRKCFFLPIEKIETLTLSRSAETIDEKNLETETLNNTMEILDARTS